MITLHHFFDDLIRAYYSNQLDLVKRTFNDLTDQGRLTLFNYLTIDCHYDAVDNDIDPYQLYLEISSL